MVQLFGYFGKHKDIFGRPGEGVHKHRFAGIAIVDYILTIVMAMIITNLTDIPFVITTILLLTLGIVMHYIFGVNTKAVQLLRGE